MSSSLELPESVIMIILKIILKNMLKAGFLKF
jgi:hypothetical protein